MNLENFVQRAHSVALEIKRDITKSERLDRTNDAVGHFLFERAGQFDGIDFDACELAMMSQTDLSKPQCAQNLFTLFDLAEALDRHLRAVGQSRGQASRSGQIRGRQSRRTRKVAYLLLRQSGLL